MRAPEFFARLGRRELSLLLLLCLAAGSLWLFIEIADEVVEGEFRQVDTAILLALRSSGNPTEPLGPAWLEEMGRDVTALGGNLVTTFVTVAAVGFLALQRKRRAAIFVAIAIASGTILGALLKSGFDRPRPDLVPHGTVTYTSSFPSGHSMTSAIVYLTLAAVLIRVQTQRRLQIYLLSIALLITLAVGISRIYLGVHWPSDVLAGWAAGSAWAVMCWAIALWMQRKGEMEKGS